MKRLIIVGLVFFVACSKKEDQNPQPLTTTKEKQICDFGIKDFNLTKRAPVDNEYGNGKPKGPGGGGSGGGGNPPPATVSGVILLDFDGAVVSNTAWNTNGPITCASANLSATSVATIIDRVTNDYSPFNITVTTDETVYNAAAVNRRQRVIITESWEWFGQAGGASFVGTFTDGMNTPCFVFSSLLNYSTKKIAEAMSHETGHTLGLRHQAVYDANCVKVSDYNSGQGSGETGWAPIMGVAYNQNLSLWHRGPNSVSCSTIQDDEAVIAALVGYRTDDHSNNFTSPTALTTSATGIINTTSDVDVFQSSLPVQKTLTVVPFNVDIYNAGANVDMIIKIYNAQGILLQTIDDITALSGSVVLAPGSYFISVGNVGNANTTNYGMIGKYTITLN